MGEMNQQQPQPPVAAPPPMGMQPMMNQVGAGAMHMPHEQFNHLAYCVHSNPSWVQVAGLAFLHYLVMLGSTVMLASTIVPRGGLGHHNTTSPSPPRSASWVGENSALPVATSSDLDLEQSNKVESIRGRMSDTLIGRWIQPSQRAITIPA